MFCQDLLVSIFDWAASGVGHETSQTSIYLSVSSTSSSSPRGVAVVAVVVVAVVVVVVALCSDPGEWVSVKWLAWGLLSAVFLLFFFLSFFLSRLE